MPKYQGVSEDILHYMLYIECYNRFVVLTKRFKVIPIYKNDLSQRLEQVPSKELKEIGIARIRSQRLYKNLYVS